MKQLLILIVILSFALPVQAADFSLGWNATFAPPHNEPVIGDKVARFRLQATPSIEFKYFRYSLEVNAWGVQKWRPSSVVGNGFPDAWQRSDWSVDTWRFTTLHKAEVGTEKLHVYVEQYMPIDRHSFGGHGMERHYFLLTGVGGRF